MTAAHPTRPQAAAWLGVLVIAALLLWRDHPHFQLGAQWDDADYVVLARSFTAGGDYGLINSPGAPGRANYPFGFPLLLAPLVALFPRNFELLKLVPTTATLANLTLLFWGWPVLARGVSRWWGVGVALLYAVSPLVVRHASVLMSEPVFLFWCLLAVLLVERAAAGAAGRWWPVGLGALSVAVVFTRTVGALPLAGLAVYLLYRRGRRALPGLAGAALAGASLLLLVVALTALRWPDLWPANYLQQNAGLVSGEARLTDQSTPYPLLLLRLSARHAWLDLRNLLLAVGGGERAQALMARLGLPWLLPLVGWALAGLTTLGWVRLLRRPGPSAFLAAALAYSAGMQLVLWTTIRFFYPVQPQLTLGLVAGVDWLGRALARGLRRPAWGPRLGRAAVLIAVTGLTLTGLRQSLLLDDSRRHAGDLAARTQWLAVHAAPSAVVMSELPRPDFLYSGLPTVDLGGYSGEAAFVAALEAQQVDYIVSGPGVLWVNASRPGPAAPWRELAPIVAGLVRAGRLTVAYASPTDAVVVYQVRP
ncbi:MAG: hypothetical protein IT317_21890 [Anaerolineales bacterium]|nr:hypothetical protein [Anaerolineales bacterium]